MTRAVGRTSIVAFAAVGLMLSLAGWTASYFFRSAPSTADDPRAHWQKAHEAIAVREFPEAAAHLLHCLQSWPFNAAAHFLMARTCRRAGQLRKWKIHLDRAEILGWPQKQIDLERQLRRAQVGNVWDVEGPLLDLLNTHAPEEVITPEEVIILEALVGGFMENDRLIDVIALTTTWSNRYPADWLPLIYRGNAELRLYGKSSEAAKDFERVLELKPNDPEAHLALAHVLTDKGQFQDALPHYQFCLRSHPDDPTEALFGLATCQYSMGDTQEARARLAQLFAKKKDYPPASFLQAKVELAEGRQEEALKWLQKADALSPDESDVTNALLQVCRQLNRQQDVARYRRRLEKIHAWDDKLDRLLTEVKTQPDDPEIRFQLGMICLERSRDQEASHWFQGILRKDSYHLPTLNVLADYYQKKGKPKMADYYRRKAEKGSGMAKSKSREQYAPKTSETPQNSAKRK